VGLIASDNCTASNALIVTQSPSPGAKVGLGTNVITLAVTDEATNSTTCYPLLEVHYQPPGVSCNGNPGHTILPPIDPNGFSVFKQGSTVPAKFRVFDANCDSVGTPGVVSSFKLVQIIYGLASTQVNQVVDSTTPDSAFRWDPTDQQWIFNVSTKTLMKNYTYVYLISLNDGTSISFQFGLK
jgi:hypothetical protein